MPKGQLHQPEYLLGDGFILQALEGMYEEHKEGDPLMHLQVVQLQDEQLLEEDWDQVWAVVEPVPGWHILPEFFVQHDHHGKDVLRACVLQMTAVATCLLLRAHDRTPGGQIVAKLCESQSQQARPYCIAFQAHFSSQLERFFSASPCKACSRMKLRTSLQLGIR